MLHRYLFVFLLITIASAVQGQDYKKFRVGLGAGRNLTDNRTGYSISIEPSYLIKSNLNLGFRLEAIATAVDVVLSGKTQGTYTLSQLISYSFSGQYYFKMKWKLRPFCGFGLGAFTMYADKGTFTSTGSTKLQSNEFTHYASRFGGYPRLGVDVGHLSVTLDYNLVPSTTLEVTDLTAGNPSVTSFRVRNSYLCLKVILLLGGGRKS